MASILALYPGQGSQSPLMATDLYQASKKVRDLFQLAGEIAGRNLYALVSEGSEDDLKPTQASQFVITLANRSAQIRLEETGHTFVGHSGFSLGELSAYAGAGILDDTTLFTIVKRRSELMDEEARKAQQRYGELGMAAVIGLGFAAVNTILEEARLPGLYASNDNGPQQVVLSGLTESMLKAKDLLTEAGARRVIPLKVSGPFHTPFMQEATTGFRAFLDSLSFCDPTSLVLSSVDGSPIKDGEDAKDHLARQLAQPVRWTSVLGEVAALAQQTGAQVAEVGYGNVLCGLCKNSKLDISCIALGQETAIQTFGKEIRQ
ncbi:MAG: ACP S-malonyltransferase [Sphaerochaeta sp.]|uniref:ACP S-malonyltransferase n=1 Tax=Sphaerochaeta sp. TaxID=1972642 RepID=UPI003D0C9BDF